jgi:uncharacterized protein (TIGR02677 family)
MVGSEYRVFSHLNQDHAVTYRAILEVFAKNREHFVIHLRPSEVLRHLSDSSACPVDEEELVGRLVQLTEWGNLERSPDRMEAATVEEFYRARFLYQLSEAGEAAESALRHFEERLHRPGELQTTALREIIDFLSGIHELLSASEPDVPKIYGQFKTLFDRFEELTQRAQTFMRGLYSTIELHGISVEDFVDYKSRLIDYLERFLGELVLATSEISRRIVELPLSESFFDQMTEQGLVDSLEPSEELRNKTRERWTGRWHGFQGWFLGTSSSLSQAEILRRRAREAIPGLLFTVHTINERRVSRSDRLADWQTLALWFAEAPGEADAHRLWRSAFSMSSARHLSINEETLLLRDQIDEGPRTSWLDAEPIRLSPRLRSTGRVTARGGMNKIIDTSKERELLAQLAAEESRQIETARELLAGGKVQFLSEFESLNPIAFDLLLDLLGEAMSARMDPLVAVKASSSDGSLTIRLEPFSSDRVARIPTRDGVLTGPDARVLISTAS